MGGSSLSSPEIISKAALIDIFGLTPFFEQTQFLTPVEKNDYLLITCQELITVPRRASNNASR